MQNVGLDGFFLNAVSAVTSRFSRSGGRGDPNSAVSLPDTVERLDSRTCFQLYQQSKFIQKIVDTYPEESAMMEPEWDVTDDDVLDVDALQQALRDLKVYNTGESYTGTMNGFVEASVLSRLDGDGFLIMGINDGQDFDQPVNDLAIRSVDWLYCCSGNYLTRDATRRDFYQFSTDIRSGVESLRGVRYIHESRVLSFAGKKLPGELFKDNGYRNDSIVQAIFSEFCRFINSVNAGAGMLSSHSIFKYKLAGLSSLKGTQGQETLVNRFTSIMLGLNSIGGLFFDANMEDADFIQRQYSGVDTLTSLILDIFVAVSDMPRSKLLGSSNSSAFSEGGQSDRYEWSQKVHAWQVKNWKSNLELLAWYLLPNRQNTIKYQVRFPSILQLTDKEQAELRNLYADADTKYITAGVLMTEEVRESRFGGTDFNTEITLQNEEPEDVEEEEAPESEDVETAEDSIKIDPVTGKIVLPDNSLIPLSDYDRILEDLETEDFNND
jgi:phage-related protein (TIGR01555 family)